MNAVEAVLVMLVLIGAGFAIQKKGWVDDSVTRFISKVVVNVALPCYMFWNLSVGYDRAKLLEILPLVPVPLLSIASSLAIGALTARVFAPLGQRGAYTAMVGFSNTIFIGLPINQLLFGDAGIPWVIVTYIANTTLFWTVGVAAIASDGRVNADGSLQPLQKMGIMARLARIFSPPIIVFLVTVSLIMIQLPMPTFLLESAKYIGAMVTPLSMLFIGMSVAQSSLRDFRVEPSLIGISLGRFVIAPLVLIAIVQLFSLVFNYRLPPLAVSVFVIQAIMPAMAQTAIIAKANGADHVFSARMTVYTTILSMAVIPVVFGIMQSL